MKGTVVITEYSLFVETSDKNGLVCRRAWGMNSTPDIQWEKGVGHTWLDCYEQIKHIFPSTLEYEYMQQSVIIDFMQGTPGQFLPVN